MGKTTCLGKEIKCESEDKNMRLFSILVLSLMLGGTSFGLTQNANADVMRVADRPDLRQDRREDRRENTAGGVEDRHEFREERRDCVGDSPDCRSDNREDKRDDRQEQTGDRMQDRGERLDNRF
jgi:hypothetical protein